MLYPYGMAARRRKRFFCFSNFVFLMSALTVFAAAVGLWIGYRFMASEFPNVAVLRTHYPVVHYHGRYNPPTITIQKKPPADWISVSQVARVAVGAIIVSEDWAFYQHKGYDPNQIKEAIQEDWEAGGFERGASTLTQQVAKNVFLNQEKSLWRKFKELILAIAMEKSVGKRKILETYLNVAEWGEGIFGIRAASRYYFSKDPADLTAKEGAFLAMLLPSPKRYSQSFRAHQMTEYARDTVESILNKMVQAHYIDETQRDRELGLPLSFELAPGSAL